MHVRELARCDEERAIACCAFYESEASSWSNAIQ